MYVVGLTIGPGRDQFLDFAIKIIKETLQIVKSHDKLVYFYFYVKISYVHRSSFYNLC